MVMSCSGETESCRRCRWHDPVSLGWLTLGACPALTVLLRRTIRNHLRRSRPEKILNVFQRIHLRFFSGLAPLIWPRLLRLVTKAMSDRLLVDSVT
jgi:hypothetical protein